MAKYEFMFVSSLEKVFPTTKPTSMDQDYVLSGLKGEVVFHFR